MSIDARELEDSNFLGNDGWDLTFRHFVSDDWEQTHKFMQSYFVSLIKLLTCQLPISLSSCVILWRLPTSTASRDRAYQFQNT